MSSYYDFMSGNEQIFTVDPRPMKFGPGAALELPTDIQRAGLQHPAVFIDAALTELDYPRQVMEKLSQVCEHLEVFSASAIEPTDESFIQAGEFLHASGCDGIVSIGGGSVIDTAKAANLLASHPAPLLDYVNAPVGAGKPVPGQLLPHIAMPTTAGTGSEATGVAVFDLKRQAIKTGISSAALKPALAIVDPVFTYTLPPLVTAATAFDVLTHAIESYTAIPYTQRAASEDPGKRPPYQGANPHSDIGAREAIRLGGDFLLRAVSDPEDKQARAAMSWAATLAGSAFGNAGVHIPHAMSYSVAGMIKNYYPDGWPDDHAMCPHGISVVVNAPAAFRFTARACPERHLEAASLLGGKTEAVNSAEAGDYLAQTLSDLMRATGIPNGLSALGYNDTHIPALVEGCMQQQRLLKQSPLGISKEALVGIYRDALQYWV